MAKLCQIARFQFHKGTIKTRRRLREAAAHPYFNSIKVQLKQKRSVLGTTKLVIFQFHKGTIKTHCFWIYNILIFNRSCECKVKKSY